MNYTLATEGTTCTANCMVSGGVAPAPAVHVVNNRPLCAYHNPYEVVDANGQTAMDTYLADFDRRHATPTPTVNEMLTRYLAGEVTKEALLTVAAEATVARETGVTYRVTKRFNVRGDRYFLHVGCDCQLNQSLLGTFATEAEAVASQTAKLTRCGRSI